MSGLEDLYREIILDHYRTPRNRGELETPPATKVDGHNPLCGDEITLYLLVDGEGERRPLVQGDFAMVSPGETHQFRNTGDEPVTLTGLQTPVAGRAEIHRTSTNSEGVSSMAPAGEM